ncbi:MAG: dCMP deaminase [Petrotoga sp.]|nr:dCMP deaminase [Petrotoga sp.]
MGKKDEVENYLKNKNFNDPNLFKERKDWDKYFMEVADLVSKRSTCLHRKVGAVIVKEKRILATGYNQPPSGFPHCDEIGCIRDDLGIKSGENQEICYGLHAEQNALMQAAKFGISTDNASIYITHQPCSVCARLIINAGIKKVYYREGYPDSLTQLFFDTCNIQSKIVE